MNPSRNQPDTTSSRFCPNLQTALTPWRFWRFPALFGRNAWKSTLPGHAYHITPRGTNRQRVFFTDSGRSTYLRLLLQNLDDAGVRVLAWCLMDNHVHFVVAPEREDSLSVLFRRVHGRYAQVVNAQRLRSGHLWQNRFYSCALSPAHLRRTLAYVERNPVRAALVERPEEYKWSSAAAEGWAELLATPEDPLDTRPLRRCTYAGRPFREDQYVALFEEQFQRVWRKWGIEKEPQFQAFVSGDEFRAAQGLGIRNPAKVSELSAGLGKIANCSYQAGHFTRSATGPMARSMNSKPHRREGILQPQHNTQLHQFLQHLPAPIG